MNEQIVSAFMNLGAVGLMLWWMTQTLIPQLQKERTEALSAFQMEAEKERQAHDRSIERLVTAMQERDKEWMGLIRELVGQKV